MKKQVNVYEMVTNRVIEQLEQGIIPWSKPWMLTGCEEALAISYASRKPYSFLNQLLLGRNGEWLTFPQIEALNGRVKKGAKASFVVFYKRYTKKKTVTDENGNEVEKTKAIPVLKHFNVFHIEDCEGIDSKIIPAELPEQPEDELEPVEMAEAVVKGYLSTQQSLRLRNDRPSDNAHYSPMFDEVVVPMMKQYKVVDEYYSTLFHELVHSTGTKERCARPELYTINHFGSKDYSREELVAELGAQMLCHKTGISGEAAFKNSVAYIGGWVKKLKEDTKAIVWAASRAEKAARYILGEVVNVPENVI